MSEDRLTLMRELVDTLNTAADSYYSGRGELMTDYEWDAMFDRLKKMEEETGTVLEDSPTINVSADRIAGNKEPHEFAALSLAKTKKPEDLVKWADHRTIWISWKLDGLTLVVTYDNGRLSKVVTRGDGHIGTNITHLADAIFGIRKTIKEKGHLVIRGEAVISYEDFEKFRIESGEDYANPRNLASGSLTLKDIDGTHYAVVTLYSGMVRYCDDRYLDIELVTNTVTGLKIPISAIVNKEFYMIPVSFEVVGGDDGQTSGFLRRTTDENGNATTEFVEADLYEKTTTDAGQEVYYVDEDTFSKGDVIQMTDSSQTYTIGDAAVLEGVYCCFERISDF